ncbi:MAG TPA: porin [Pirellulales bacterium]
MLSRPAGRFLWGLAVWMLLSAWLAENCSAQSPGSAPPGMPLASTQSWAIQPPGQANAPPVVAIWPAIAPIVMPAPGPIGPPAAPAAAGPWNLAMQPAPGATLAPSGPVPGNQGVMPGQPMLAGPQAGQSAPPPGVDPAAPPAGQLPPPLGANLTPEQQQQAVTEYLQRQGGAVGPAAGDYQIGTQTWLRPAWRNGLVFDSPNGDFTFHLGGRFQMDTTAFNDNQNITDNEAIGGTGPIEDAVYVRRARLRADGTAYDVIDWVVEYEFANTIRASVPFNPPGSPPITAAPSPTDLYIRMRELPVVGNFQVGNFKEPIGFEHLVNDSWGTFMERSFNQDVFYGPYNNGYSPGLMIFDWTENERMTYALWVGPNTHNTFGYQFGGQYAATGRLTYLPYYDGNGRYLVHLGSSISYRNPDQGQFRATAFQNIRSAPYGPALPIMADTGSLQANGQSLYNLEFASVWGPLTVQAEYTAEWVSDVTTNPLLFYVPRQQANLLSGSTLLIQGGYVEASWFLTGEHRAYNRQSAVFERIVPNENFYLIRGARGCSIFGRGAWQSAIRFSAVDLNGRGLNGGNLTALTLGVNWYLNPNMKFQFNYDTTWRGQVASVGSQVITGVGARFSLDF